MRRVIPSVLLVGVRLRLISPYIEFQLPHRRLLGAGLALHAL